MPRKVTVDDMVDALREAGRPCTKQDIADITDVSRQTIANYADELEGDPRIEYGKVGTANAYWLAVEYDPDELDGEPQTPDTDYERDISGIKQPPAHTQGGFEQEQTRFAPPNPTNGDNMVERIAHRRTAASGALFLLIGLVFLPTAALLHRQAVRLFREHRQ